MTVGFLAAAEPRLGAAVAAGRAGGGRVVVANYLLAPGYFHDLAVRLADGSPVARPLLDDDAPAASLVDLVVDRRSLTLDRPRQLCDAACTPRYRRPDTRIGRGPSRLILSRCGLDGALPGHAREIRRPP